MEVTLSENKRLLDSKLQELNDIQLDSKAKLDHISGHLKQKQAELKDSHDYIKQIEQEKSGL